MSWQPNYKLMDHRLGLVLKDRNIVAYDSFNRPDSDFLGYLDTGQKWDDVSAIGEWGIRDNSAGVSVGGVGDRILFNSEISDGVITVKFKKLDPTTSGSGTTYQRNGIVFRGSDIFNLYIVRFSSNELIFQRRVNDSNSSVGSYPIDVDDGAILKLLMDGNNVSLYLNNNLIFTHIDDVFTSNKSHGIYTTRSTETEYDYFKLEGLTNE